MKSDRLLYLCAYQLNAYHWVRGELRLEAQFTTAVGQPEFSEYLAQHAGSVFSVVVNVQEEGFHIETIPFLQGRDRKALIARKLQQLFFNAPLSTAHSLGYEKTRRKDERLLFAALTNHELLTPWLTRLVDSDVALAGIYSLPLLGASLLARLPHSASKGAKNAKEATEEHTLLLTVQDQTVRQSYFQRGELYFSRLTPLADSSIQGLASAFASETAKLIQYLASQRALARGQALTAYILAHESAHPAIRQRCVDTDALRFELIGVAACAQRIGLKSTVPDSLSEALFIHLAAAAPPTAQFAGEAHRHRYRLRQINSGLYRAGGVCLAACLLFAAVQLANVWRLGQQADDLLNEAALARQRYERIAQTFPPLPMSHDSLRQIIGRYAALEKQASSPLPLMVVISKAIQNAPAVELETIDWKTGGLESATAAAGGAAKPQAAGARVVPEGSEAAIVRGLIRMPPNTNPRQVLGAFNRFADALKADPALQVDVLQQPFDVEPGKSLRGADTTADSDKPRPFSVQVTRKVGT